MKKTLLLTIFCCVLGTSSVYSQNSRSAKYKRPQTTSATRTKQQTSNNTQRQRQSSASSFDGQENGHGWVDLGLSVKWATCNVGANNPNDNGSYFAWGETQTKSRYDWDTYKWCRGTSGSLTKYCINSAYGNLDNKTVLSLSDDAANANWGGAWRTPTKAELEELRTKCTWTWNVINSVKGYKVTSNSNGKSIFLPANGWPNEGTVNRVGVFGSYWSSTIHNTFTFGASCIQFSSIEVKGNFAARCAAQSVRAVCPF